MSDWLLVVKLILTTVIIKAVFNKSFWFQNKKKCDCTGCNTWSLYGDVDDADVLVRLVGLGVDFGVGDPLDRLHAFRAPSKNSVLVVEPRLGKKKEKEGGRSQHSKPQARDLELSSDMRWNL